MFQAIGYTAEELVRRGPDQLPPEFISSKHLIYSSPAALAFNSPGAEGFGVKRAALSIPGSALLLVAPGCCGRNTSLVSNLPGYENRFFYINMDETDIITGRHLKKIPKAVEDIVHSLTPAPSLVMICITCTDALLGTDMERVCKKAREKVGIPVRPCYMYALTREGRKPPMVHVRQSLYSLLEPRKKRGTSVNILGYFAPLMESCELYDLLRKVGVKTIREISRCRDYEDYQAMAEANFNLVLHPEARPAAMDLEKRLRIPFIELRRVYQIDKIHHQYQALGQVLGTSLEEETIYKETLLLICRFRERYMAEKPLRLSIGECLNGDAFELALAMVRYGFIVSEIFGTVTGENYIYIKKLAALSPETKIYSNLEPTMLYYDQAPAEVDLTLGKDAGYYHPGLPHVEWNQDIQPFGYAGVTALFREMEEALTGVNKENTGSGANTENIRSGAADPMENYPDLLLSHTETYEEFSEKYQAVPDAGNTAENGSAGMTFSLKAPGEQPAEVNLAAYRKYLTPFAPDQSGAESVLFELGGISVVCDAGGCVGNICGFDEPRWFSAKSAVFSAGLRDMDAILGRDARLVEKLVEAAERIDARFAAIIGTPVPSVIGTDYQALKRMAEKKLTIPCLSIDTNGMELYDVGEEKAYLALMKTFAGDDFPLNKDSTEENPAAAGKKITDDRVDPVLTEDIKDPASADDGVNPVLTEDIKDPASTDAKVNPILAEDIIAPTSVYDPGNSVAADDRTYPEEKNECSSSKNAVASQRILGVLGVTPLEMSRKDAGLRIQQLKKRQGWSRVMTYGMNSDLEDIRQAHLAEVNLVCAPSGLKAARYLQQKYGIPYEIEDPLAEEALNKGTESCLREMQAGGQGEPIDAPQKTGDEEGFPDGKNFFYGKRILVAAQQVTGHTLRELLRKDGAFSVTVATWFMKCKELEEPGDISLKSERQFRELCLSKDEDGAFSWDVLICDKVLWPMIPEFPGLKIDLPHFALSGRMYT